MFEFFTHEKFSFVQHFSIHLSNQQTIYFDDDLTITELQLRLNFFFTKLLTYFDYNQKNTNDKKYLYHDFSAYYVWKQSKKQWQIRKRNFFIDCIYFCNFFADEKYFLRLFLTIVSNVTCYDDFRVVNNELYFIFQLTCATRELINDDRKWILCFEKIVKFFSNYILRKLFKIVLIYEMITNSFVLWKKFAKNLCDDLSRRLRNIINVFNKNTVSNTHLNYDFYLINKILSNMKKILTNYKMSQLIHDWNQHVDNSLIVNELNYEMFDKQNVYDEKYAQLNTNQRHCFNMIVSNVKHDLHHVHFFVQKFVGIEKTFLYKILCHYFWFRDDIVFCVAFSNIAFLFLSNEQIFHFIFNILLQIIKNIVCNIIRNTHLYGFLKRMKLIIWNEIFMQHKYCFTNVHRFFTNIMNNDFIFDNISIIFENDFDQILSIIKKNNRKIIVNVNIQRFFFDFIFIFCIYGKTSEFVTKLSIKRLRNKLKKCFMILF